MNNKQRFYQDFFRQVHRTHKSGVVYPLEERFAGANANIPLDVQTILDVGCGSGDFLNSLLGKYLKVGVDLCDEPLQLAKFSVVVGRIDVLPFGSTKFDLVSCFELLEHLSYQEFPKAISELERVARKYILISVPNQELLHQSLVSCSQCCCMYNPSWHVRSFIKSSLHSIFPKFRLIEYKACGPMIRQHDSKLVSLYRLWNPRRPPPSALCPQCGYLESFDGSFREFSSGKARLEGKTVLVSIKRVVRNLVESIFIRYKSRPYWLLALYERV